MFRQAGVSIVVHFDYDERYSSRGSVTSEIVWVRIMAGAQKFTALFCADQG